MFAHQLYHKCFSRRIYSNCVSIIKGTSVAFLSGQNIYLHCSSSFLFSHRKRSKKHLLAFLVHMSHSLYSWKLAYPRKSLAQSNMYALQEGRPLVESISCSFLRHKFPVTWSLCKSWICLIKAIYEREIIRENVVIVVHEWTKFLYLWRYKFFPACDAFRTVFFV